MFHVPILPNMKNKMVLLLRWTTLLALALAAYFYFHVGTSSAETHVPTTMQAAEIERFIQQSTPYGDPHRFTWVVTSIHPDEKHTGNGWVVIEFVVYSASLDRTVLMRSRYEIILDVLKQGQHAGRYIVIGTKQLGE